MTETALHIAMAVCAGYLTIVYGSYLALMVAGLFEARRRRREAATEDYATLSCSRFLPPVSVLLPAYNEQSTVVAATHALLQLDYPDVEVIVIDDGSSDETLATLVSAFALLPAELSSRRPAADGIVITCYRSATDRRLVVLAKENNGKADALNVGLGYARGSYILGVDADTVLAPDALVRTMRVALQDPQRVVGVTSYVDVHEIPAQWMAEPRGRRRSGTRPLLVAFQALDYMRAFFNNRVAWSRYSFMLCSIGAFQIWRRDIVEELGGWSTEYTCEDIELTFRVHERMRASGRDYAILCLPDAVGATEGPNSVRRLVAQRERWQRVTLETWWSYRHMLGATRYGTVGLIGMPFYLLCEILAPFFELLAALTLLVGVVLGVVDWQTLAYGTLLMTLVNGILNAGAVGVLDAQAREHSLGSLVRLLLLAPVELLVYRPIISWARVKGTYRFFRGDRSWHKFERNTPLPVPT